MVIPDYQNDTVPLRYPFADVFIYAYDEEHDILAYTNKWKDLVPTGTGFNPSSKWPNGTILTEFGNFEISGDLRRVLGIILNLVFREGRPPRGPRSAFLFCLQR